MGALEILNHLSNFAAPAFGIALLLPLLSRLGGRRKGVSGAWTLQFGVILVAGLAALVAGLWIFGRDGKMATYAGLVLACGTAQWVLQRR